MLKTVGDACVRIGLAFRSIHRLQKEIPEIKSSKSLRGRICLRIDQLQLVTRPLLELRRRLDEAARRERRSEASACTLCSGVRQT